MEKILILLHPISDGEEIIDFSIQDDDVAGSKKNKGFDISNWKEGNYSLTPLPPLQRNLDFILFLQILGMDYFFLIYFRLMI